MKLLTPLLAVVALVALIGNVLQYERYSTRKPVVTVGSQPISKFEYETAIEQAAGAPVLKKMVYSDLVRQAAAKAGVIPTSQEIDARIADMKRRQPQVAAQAQNAEFRQNLADDMSLENLRIKDITASDAEINAFYSRNQGAFAIPAQVQTTMVVSEHQSDADTAVHLLQQDVKPETIAGQPHLHVVGVNGFNINMNALPPAVGQGIRAALMSTKAGQIKTLPVGKYFLTYKVKSSEPAVIPPLAQIKDQVARQVKLQKAINPQAELALLYQNNTPTFNVQRYATFFTDVQNYNAQAGRKTASAQ